MSETEAKCSAKFTASLHLLTPIVPNDFLVFLIIISNCFEVVNLIGYIQFIPISALSRINTIVSFDHSWKILSCIITISRIDPTSFFTVQLNMLDDMVFIESLNCTAIYYIHTML